jgi:RNA polymerase sigma factor (sigma-70 family)
MQVNNTVLDYEDFKQEAYIKCLQAIERYDPSKNVSLTTYLFNRVDWAMSDLIRRSRGREMLIDRSHPRYLLDSIDTFEDWNLPDSLQSCDFDKMSEKIDLSIILDKLDKHLTAKERQFIYLYLKGYKNSEIAAELKCSPSNILNYIDSLKTKYNKIFSNLNNSQ